MDSPTAPTSSNSSALFESDDSTFLKALGTVVLPGDNSDNGLNPKTTTPDATSHRTPVSPTSPSNDKRHLQPTVTSVIGVEQDHQRVYPANSRHRHPEQVPSTEKEPSLSQRGTPTPVKPKLKRARHSSDEDEDAIDSSTNSRSELAGSYAESDTYGASRFGEFGEYMRRKRAKLQIQNADMDPSK
ncbi:hypothetical protein BC834DRAFT_971141 [Gloeopeniophorella convolvens]|nr:hypothetical protein BC834DRAFT_971141 [Gloeopeniophorella convolvens]